MVVKCINNFGASESLIEGELYTVKLKKKLQWRMTLVGKSGLYEINRFIKTDGTRIRQDEMIINYHYLPTKDTFHILKYVKLRNNSPLKSLKKDTFYEIRSFSVDGLGRPCVNLKDILWPYKWDSFVYYTDEDYKSINRKDIINVIKEKLKQTD